MPDRTGLKAAAQRGIALGPIGHRIVLENEHVRVWEVRLAPGTAKHLLAAMLLLIEFESLTAVLRALPAKQVRGEAAVCRTQPISG